jgi:hypothetical protein
MTTQEIHEKMIASLLNKGYAMKIEEDKETKIMMV